MSAGSAALALVRDRDWVLSLLALAGAGVSLSLLLSPPKLREPTGRESPVIATVSFAATDLRRRPDGTLVWEDIGAGIPVRHRDAVFVPPGGEARISFPDGTSLEVDENSLVVLEAPGQGEARIDLRQGSLIGSTGAGGVEIRGKGGTTHLGGQTQARIDVEDKEARIDVFTGTAKVKTSRGEHLLVDKEVAALSTEGELVTLPERTLELQSPPRNERFFYRGSPEPVELRWAGEAPGLLQVARDRGFGFVVQQARTDEGSAAFAPPSPGVFWWRIVDGRGNQLSEARRFTVIEDVPPKPLAPLAKEVVWASPDHPALFSWTAVKNATAYRLELSATVDFKDVSFDATVNAPQLWFLGEVPEGHYYWRVRAEDKMRGESSYTRPIYFRLIHRPLPAVPEVMGTEIEVDGK